MRGPQEALFRESRVRAGAVSPRIDHGGAGPACRGLGSRKIADRMRGQRSPEDEKTPPHNAVGVRARVLLPKMAEYAFEWAPPASQIWSMTASA